MAKRLLPTLNRVLVEKLVPPSKTNAGILLPEKSSKASVRSCCFSCPSFVWILFFLFFFFLISGSDGSDWVWWCICAVELRESGCGGTWNTRQGRKDYSGGFQGRRHRSSAGLRGAPGQAWRKRVRLFAAFPFSFGCKFRLCLEFRKVAKSEFYRLKSAFVCVFMMTNQCRQSMVNVPFEWHLDVCKSKLD